MQALLDAVSTPRRREILRLVWDAERPAGDIAAHFDVAWPSISRSLRAMKDAGAVVERREGTHRYYRADRDALAPLEEFLTAFWTEGLGRLGRQIEANSRGRRARRATGRRRR